MMAWIEMGSVTSEVCGRSAERFAFRQGANVAQAFGHDAQAWAKYQCQSHAWIFKGTPTAKINFLPLVSATSIQRKTHLIISSMPRKPLKISHAACKVVGLKPPIL
jgi:hypothetical protein